MYLMYGIIFLCLIMLSAFFSSAETSLLSLSRIRLAHRAKQRQKKAVMLERTLANPDEFFSTILIGNNLVNIAAASISTLLVSRLITADEREIILLSTAATTLVILLFAEIIPKTYAFRHSEKLSYLYAYPVGFFRAIFYPVVKVIAFITRLVFRRRMTTARREFSPEEVKHFLESEIQLFKYSPETLKIVHEMIDIVQKDIKTVMTPRPEIVALAEGAGLDEVKEVVLERKIGKIPIFSDSLDDITGIVTSQDLLKELMVGGGAAPDLRRIAAKPLFVSEYSPLNYVLREFKKRGAVMAVVLDEYGSTLGIVTMNDIFREIFAELELQREPIKRLDRRRFLVEGQVSVDELNGQLGLGLPERKDYTTLAGLFIYHHGRLPDTGSAIVVGPCRLVVKRMTERKIEEILVVVQSS